VRRSALLGTLVVSAVGCVETVRFEVPEANAHASAILAIERSGGLEVRALDLRGGSIDDAFAFDPRRALKITALLYDQPLAELRIAAGRIAPAPAGVPAMPLPTASAIFEADKTGVWSKVEAADDAIRSFTIEAEPAIQHCPLFTNRSQEIGSASGIVGLHVLLSDTSVLLATSDGAHRVATATTVGPVIFTSTVSAAGLGYRAPDGRILLVDASGALRRLVFQGARATLELVAPAAPFTARPAHVDGSRDGPAELFLITDMGRVSRWSEAQPNRWIDVGNYNPVEPQCGSRRVAWIAPGSVIVTSCDAFIHLFRAGDAAPTVSTPPPSPNGAPWTLAGALAPPGGGVIVAAQSDRHAFLRFEPSTGAWSEPARFDLDDSAIGRFTSLLGYRDGYLASGFRAGIRSFDEAHGFCTVSELNVRHLLAAKDTVIGISDQSVLGPPTFCLHWWTPMR
jgi:hypothetical protein